MEVLLLMSIVLFMMFHFVFRLPLWPRSWKSLAGWSGWPSSETSPSHRSGWRLERFNGLEVCLAPDHFRKDTAQRLPPQPHPSLLRGAVHLPVGRAALVQAGRDKRPPLLEEVPQPPGLLARLRSTVQVASAMKMPVAAGHKANFENAGRVFGSCKPQYY